MYKITIPQNSSSNCYDSVIYSLLKFYNFDYEAYNIKYFYTDYYRVSVSNINYCICRGKYYENILKDIYNIDLVYKGRDESINLFEIIYSSLSNIRPIGITIDPYNCYWSPLYQKSHYSHMILIIDIDYNNQKYICFDVYFGSIGYVSVDFDIINKNYEYYFTFDFKKVNELNLELVINKINNLLNNFDNNLDIKKAEMINYFTKNDIKALFAENLETSIPLINLMWIAEDKKNFSIALRYIENKIKKVVFSPIYELSSASERNFLLLKSMLIKYAMTGILREDSLKNIINKIFDTDAIMIEQMKSMIGEIV